MVIAFVSWKRKCIVEVAKMTAAKHSRIVQSLATLFEAPEERLYYSSWLEYDTCESLAIAYFPNGPNCKLFKKLTIQGDEHTKAVHARASTILVVSTLKS